ncbi:MAG: putative DNA-binding transcriptional regulator AlpA [Spirosomataceae bacterium]
MSIKRRKGIVKMTQISVNPFEGIMEKLHSIELRVEKLTPPQPTAPPPPEERFVDQKEVAGLYGVSTVSIWQWEKKGFIKSYRIGNLKRFKYTEIINAPKFINRTKKSK